jgi:exopolysaccharide production protein ExoZ
MSTSGRTAALPRLHGLQYLRAIAATMVAFLHTGGQIPAYLPHLDCPRLGTGVDLFFVISGFIMAVTGVRLSGGEFLTRRLLRIVPLYWLLTTVLALLVVLRPQLFRSTALTAGSYLLSLLFVPFHNTALNGALKPLLIPGWSLNYEMFFYVIFAVVLWAKPQRIALVSGCILGLLTLLGLVLPGFYTQPLILEFWLGVLVARTYERLRLPAGACVTLILGGFAGLLSNDFVPVQQLSATAVVLGTVCWERRGGLPLSRTAVALGDASYSLYLIHVFVLGITRVLWLMLFQDRGQGRGAAAYAIFSITAVILAALACHRWVETPMTEALRRLWGSPVRAARPGVPPATA